MEILEVVSYHQTEKITEVTFRLINDESDMIRTDIIENTFFDEFGYEYLSPVADFLFDDDNEFGDSFDGPEYVDEDDLTSFLNEYYIVYPEKLPQPEYE